MSPGPGRGAPSPRRLPLLLGVPHAGWRIPDEAAPCCRLTPDEIEADGDVGAREIYDLAPHVEAFVTTDIARAIVDMNRAPHDIRKDGVVKTHTCWDVPVYDHPLPGAVAEALIRTYHGTYHDALRLAARHGVVAGVDCHTMAAHAPPEAPDPGQPRPRICLSDAHGTLPRAWFDALASSLEGTFGCPVSRNEPFQGGYIIREHSQRLPWVQLELSREEWMPLREKRERVLGALTDWTQRLRRLPVQRGQRPARQTRAASQRARHE